MATDITDRSQPPIETGRTWRDLPPEPPDGAVPEPGPAPERPRVAATAVSPTRRTAAILAAAIAMLLLVAVGAFALVGANGEPEAEPVAVASTAPPTTTAPAPSPTDPTLPDLQGLLDPFLQPDRPPTPEDLQQLFDDLLGSLGAGAGLEDLFGELPPELRDLLDEPGIAPSTLVTPGELPEGYTVDSTKVTAIGGSIQQVTRLDGPEGPVAIRATSGDAAASIVSSASGEAVTVAGHDGRLEADPLRIRLVVAYAPDLAVEIIAPAELGTDAVLSVAEHLEVG